MKELIQEYIMNPCVSLTATDKLILLTLAEHVTGLRIEDIARVTGSKFRWMQREISRLTRLGVLRRVSPGTYSIKPDPEVHR